MQSQSQKSHFVQYATGLWFGGNQNGHAGSLVEGRGTSVESHRTAGIRITSRISARSWRMQTLYWAKVASC
jgi:hypothetical protein